jgi:hypothetical protein
MFKTRSADRRDFLEDSSEYQSEAVSGGLKWGCCMSEAALSSAFGYLIVLRQIVVLSQALCCYLTCLRVPLCFAEDDPKEWPGPKAWPASLSLISFFAVNVFGQALLRA